MHTSSIVGILLLFVYFWNKEECNWKKKSILLFVMVPITYVGFSKVKDAYEIYAKYKMRMQDNNVATEVKGNLRGNGFNSNAITDPRKIDPIGPTKKGKNALIYTLVALAGAGIIYAITRAVKNKKSKQETQNDNKNLSAIA